VSNWKPEDEDRHRDLKSDPPGRKLLMPLVWILIALGVVALGVVLLDKSRADDMDYVSFREQLRAGNVEQITMQGQRISGVFGEPVPRTGPGGATIPAKEFVTYVPPTGDPELLPLLESQQVPVTIAPALNEPGWRTVLNFLPLLALVGVGLILFKRVRPQGPDASAMLRSGAKPYTGHKVPTTFNDVAGAQGTKTELQEIIEFLKNPARYERLGAEIPKGVLLVGPPGTGKTLLARAVAGEANVPFFSITGSNFVEVFVGVGASRVRDLFQEAKKKAPSIIFIDELDSIGRRRGLSIGGSSEEREQTLNQLLAEMDGFEPTENVIVMASTNRPDVLDPALMRPGRFDRHVTVDLPTMHDRHEILKIHARNKPLAPEVQLEQIARATPGFSGADLENLLNEAALLAARRNKEIIDLEEIEEAKDKVLMGLARENLALTDEELQVIAVHEAGHAVVAAVLPHADPIHKVTIVPRGRAMGVTQQLPDGEKFIYPREYMLDRLAVMMGGRAAEDLVLGTVTTGAENDLKQATRLARRMVLDWGMGNRLGLVSPGSEGETGFLGEEFGHHREYSELTAREIDEEIKEFVETAYTRARAILQRYRCELEGVARALREQEIIPGETVLELVRAGNGERQRAPDGLTAD